MENVQSESNIDEKQAALNMDHKCTVCHKSYCEPKLLPCGHLMCRKCLLSWLEQTRHATCPYCRYPILKDDGEWQATPSAGPCQEDVPTEGDQGCTDVDDEKLQVMVDSFPTELLTAALVKAEKLLCEKQKCHVCEEQATSLCLQCGDTLCGSCKNIHTKFTMSSHHVVEEISSLTAERLADFQPPTLCPQHPVEQCRMFCTQHTTSLCMQCALSGHSNCPQITDLKQMEQSREKLKDILNKIMDGSTCIEKALSEMDQHLTDMEQRTEAALVEILILKHRLTNSVDDFTHCLEQKTKAAWEDIREAVKEAKAGLLSRQSRLGSHMALVQRVLTSTARDVVCGMTSVMEARVKELELHVELPEKAKDITTATLLVDENVVVWIEQELAKLVDLKVELAAMDVNVRHRFHPIHGQNITLSNSRRTATRSQGINYSAVVVSKPMAIGDLIEVQVDKWNTNCRGKSYNGYPFVGVTTESPDTINFKRQPMAYQMSSTSIVTYNAAFISGASVGSYTAQFMSSVGQGTRVGVYLDNDRNLHLYINGGDCGVFAYNVTQPCYALFDVCDYAQQVTLLERRKV